MAWKTTHCPASVSPKCPGHQGWEKFPDCLTEALYAAPDETTGDVDGFGYWYGLVIQEKAETLESDTCPVTIPAGTFWLISESNQGHVTVTEYLTAQEAQQAYDLADIAYGEWCAGQDYAEYSIVSSTGQSIPAVW
jgi:hypothetical protein